MPAPWISFQQKGHLIGIPLSFKVHLLGSGYNKNLNLQNEPCRYPNLQTLKKH